VHNQEIAAIFEEIADLLEIENANPFRVRAYRTAAQLIAAYSRPLHKMVADKEDLTRLPGIGADLAQKIKTIVKTGQLPLLKQLEKGTPKSVLAMLTLPGLGPKRVKMLFQQLKIKTLSDLEKAARTHQIRGLRGFSDKTETAILTELTKRTGQSVRYPYASAEEIAEELVTYLKKSPDVGQVIVAGSYRRKKDTVADLDLLATAKRNKPVIDYFIKFYKIAAVLSHGATRSTVRLSSGMQVDLRVVPESSYGAALAYFTGSKSHNIAVRKLAVRRHLKLNEYGVFKNSRKIAGKTEEEVYRIVDLPYIEPELRENRGEIEAAKRNQLPHLVQLTDLRGDLHCHTNATDGRDTLEAMAQAAIDLDYEYIAITDHTQHLSVTKGQNPKRVLAQIKSINDLNERLYAGGKTFQILKSAEVDILEDGQLDLPDRILKQLDLAVCSIHSKFNLPIKKQTERIIRAMDNPFFTILGHPSGRLLNRRDPYPLNFEAIFAAAKQRGKFIEVNAQPDRLDLTDELCRLAKEMGLKLAISTDAHSIDQLHFMPYGINQARRGWLEPADIINTRPLNLLLSLFKSKR